MRFEIDWVNLSVKFTVFALFIFEGNFPSTSPRGLCLAGQFNGGFFVSPLWGLTFGGAYFQSFTIVLQVRYLVKLL